MFLNNKFTALILICEEAVSPIIPALTIMSFLPFILKNSESVGIIWVSWIFIKPEIFVSAKLANNNPSVEPSMIGPIGPWGPVEPASPLRYEKLKQIVKTMDKYHEHVQHKFISY
mgnify:FL=1